MPAITNYVESMEVLLKVFKILEQEAKSIQQDCRNIKEKAKSSLRARIHFDQLKEKSKNLKTASLELIVFYEVAHAKFLAMKNSRGNLSYVSEWKE